ncbi:MAG: family 2 glycosyl transferase [Thermodesulfovibrio sp.]|nr:family 2 glycosyl transferase [Thermodesulfovibrio sp.]
MRMTTKVTVLLPVFNGMPYLPEAVDSILNQTLQDFTLLIIDDGSTDGSSSYLNGLHDPRVRIVYQENQGQGAALNRGIGLCDTEYIARMDADDISLPRRLEFQVDYMEHHPDVVMLGSQIKMIAGIKEFAGPRLPLSHEDIRKLLMKEKAVFCHGAGIFRTGIMRKIGGYRLLKSGQDTDLFLRMSEAGKVVNLDEVLYLMRFHRESDNYLKQAEINRAVKYAAECAKCRERGIQEPAYDEYTQSQNGRSSLARFLVRVDCWSALEYRNSLLDFAESRRIRGSARLICASLLRPEAVIRRISGYLATKKKGKST